MPPSSNSANKYPPWLLGIALAVAGGVGMILFQSVFSAVDFHEGRRQINHIHEMQSEYRQALIELKAKVDEIYSVVAAIETAIDVVQEERRINAILNKALEKRTVTPNPPPKNPP